MKILIGAIAAILAFVGYIPYIKDTLRGKTKPHAYTWFIWALVSSIAFALQLSDHAGPGAYLTLAAAIMCFVIFLLSISSKRGGRNITILDTAFLILALISLVVWGYVKQPVIAVILISLVDIFGFFPTIRKSWHAPYQETLSSYILNTVRFFLGLIALERYTIITTLYPATWVVANGLFAIVLIIRRRQVGNMTHR